MKLAARLARLMRIGAAPTIPKVWVQVGYEEPGPDAVAGAVPLIPFVRIRRCHVSDELREALEGLALGSPDYLVPVFSVEFDDPRDRDPDPDDIRGLILANVTEPEAELLRSARTWLVAHPYYGEGGPSAPVVPRLGLVDVEDGP